MIYFLASLPRSGSTLLTSLLNQRPDVYASPTSNLCDIMGATVMAWEQNPTTQASGGTEKDLIRILKGIEEERYDTDKLVFDKSRGWSDPTIIKTMMKVQGDVKIVTTVRPVAECLASFVKIANPDNVNDFCKNSQLAQHLFSSYNSLKLGYEECPDVFLLIEYDNLIKDAQTQLDCIADFIGLDHFKHDLVNVKDSKEKDKIWGIKNLHSVHKKVSKRRYSRKNILGKRLWDFYQGGEFWNDKKEPQPKKDLLDVQLDLSLRGDFKKSAQISGRLLKERPDCNRVAFNAGWHALRDGNLLEGHKLLDKGRDEEIFGNKDIGSIKPIWNGEEGTVLLNLEGGLGDQIKSYRWAFDLKERGNRVIISCSPELASVFAEKFSVVEHGAACAVYHDYWLPSMSAIVPFGYEYEDLKGKPYISRTANTISGRIGVRWRGNPQFEHEQYRIFSSDYLFDVVKGYDCVSLQKDENKEVKPNWMKECDLSTWQKTREAISKCELVISSCTSVAHLSAAMGIPTWIVVPILSYYVWALPGDKTPYYDSVTLFRQEKYGDWSAPFEQIKEKLKCMHTLKMAA